MKLQSHYNKITILSTISILVIAAIGYYSLMHYVLQKQLDEELKEEEAEVLVYIQKNGTLPEATSYKDQLISFEKTDQPVTRHFKSVTIYFPGEKEKEPSRQLLFPIEAGGQKYTVSVTKSDEANEKLITIILVTTIALILLLTILLYISNRVLFKKLWQPFRGTLSAMKDFNLAAPTAIPVTETAIDEFRQLNESVSLMTQKVMKDYQSLKNFTDHASHEIQTPLAVINSKLDVLIQEPELSEKSLTQVQGVYQAVEKLSRLSHSLLLLTKIGSNQFNETHGVPLHQVTGEVIAQMQDWSRSKELRFVTHLEELTVSMHRELAEILVNNLIKNAIRHSQPGSAIVISTSSKTFSITNPGTEPLDKNKIFDRFYKSPGSEGTGLGLAIVQQICEQYAFTLSYHFSDGKHSFRVGF